MLNNAKLLFARIRVRVRGFKNAGKILYEYPRDSGFHAEHLLSYERSDGCGLILNKEAAKCSSAANDLYAELCSPDAAPNADNTKHAQTNKANSVHFSDSANELVRSPRRNLSKRPYRSVRVART
ncbi:hypothetical protein PUN28_002306 [Cardiocondyla obscurior]|uniref:Uncharacterized protein n=1 Tax=Cardiocondyla obscurior TaxID=286306 RepID=A0AAW2GTJ8_9HYME